MIVLRVIGGLGNQMFQIAFARIISLQTSDELIIDCSSYEKYKIRKFSAQNLNIIDSVKYIEDTNLSFIRRTQYKFTLFLFRVYRKIVRKVTKRNELGEKSFLSWAKNGFYYNFDRYFYETPRSNNNMKYIYGYFQSAKYYENYEEIIKKEMKVKTLPTNREQNIIDEIKSCDAVGISIRVGDDYLLNADLNVCNEDYYYKGMDYLFRKNKNVVFYVFSDSVERVRERFEFKYPVKYIEDFKDYESMRLLYTCKYFIISNSSFSWWGAYLSDRKNKEVIAPNKWYANSNSKPDIFMNDMILIEV